MSRRKSEICLTDVQDALGPISLSQEELQALTGAIQQRSPQAIRVHQDIDVTQLPFASESVPWAERGFWVAPDVRPSKSVHYATGDFYIQDAGSLLAIALCDVLSDMQICDLCAAPGGKASAIAEQITGDGWLLANEPIRSRVAPLRYNLCRTGRDRWIVSSLDPETLAEVCAGQFDRVLVDAPCSGQALLGRGRQSGSALSTRQIEHSALRQQRILEQAIRLLSPGGILIYSTCTFAYMENEAHWTWLQNEHSMIPAPLAQMAAYESPGYAGCYRLWPHRDRCSGAFAMRLQLEDQTESSVQRRRLNNLHLSEFTLPQPLESWGTLTGQRAFREKSCYYSWPEGISDPLIKVALVGPEVSHLVGQTWQPSHALALRTTESWQPRESIEIERVDGESSSRGETFSSDRSGWTVVTHRARPLGWGKASAGTMKNQIPKYARLRY